MGRVGLFKGLHLLGGQSSIPASSNLADSMALQDMLCKLPIAIHLGSIDHGEDDVETAEQRWREIDLFRDVLVFVESAELRIRSGEDRATRLKDGCDSCLCDANPLLFHCLVDRGPILWVHLLDFVDAVVDHDPVANEVAETRHSEVVNVSVVFFDPYFDDSVKGVVASGECLETIVVITGKPRFH